MGLKRMILTRFGLVCLFMGGPLSASEIISFSPQGPIKNARQVRASFLDPMISFGDMTSPKDPFDIQCNAPGKSRWADDKNWIYDFDADLAPGLKCVFKLKPGTKTLDQKDITGQQEYSFYTTETVISRSNPYEGSTITEDQAFVLTLDGHIQDQDLNRWIYFLVDGIGEPIPAKLITGSNQKKILQEVNRYSYQSESTDQKQPQVLVVQAQRPFPNDGKVTLVWGKDSEQKLKFQVQKVFSAQFHCERETPEASCIPLSPMQLNFSRSVSMDQAKKTVLIAENGKKYFPTIDEDSNDDEEVSFVRFKGPFPEKTQFKLEVPKGLKDDSGRHLTNQSAFPLDVKTDALPPLAKFSGDFGILEAKGNVLVPVTLRRLEESGKIQGRKLKIKAPLQANKIVEWMAQIQRQEQYESRGTPILAQYPSTVSEVQEFVLDKPNGADAFEVAGIPISEPGFHVIEVESRVLGKKLLAEDRPMYVSTSVLVTQMAVHFKKGRESSLAWVTSLEDAKPVAGAQVKIQDCKGNILAQGLSHSDGTVRFGTLPEKLEECVEPKIYNPYGSGLFVTAEKDGDFSFVHSHWNRGIEYWRYDLPRDYWTESLLAHTVLDRSLFRAGETVQMRHFLRQHSSSGFSPVLSDDRPQWIQIEHLGSDQKFEFPVHWKSDLTAEMNWKVPVDAKTGAYSISFVKKNSTYPKSWRSGQFRVEEFRVPLMKADIRPPTQPLINAETMVVDFSVKYLSGGGADSLPVHFRYQQKPIASKSFPDFDGFTFSNGLVQEGTYTRDSEQDESKSQFQLEKRQFNLDSTGASRLTLDHLRKLEQMSSVSMELEFQDPNGEIQTASAAVPIYTSNRLVGIKSEYWSNSKGSVKFQTAVVDPKGKPVAGAPVEVSFFSKKTYTHRKKIVGGFYSYENKYEIVEAGKACSGVTDSGGLFRCEVSSKVFGRVILQAKTEDENHRPSFANTSVYIHGSSSSWFSQGDHDRIDLLPQKKYFEPGEKAVFQVESPFREATALVTVEREGVLDSFVVPISGEKPLIEVPIKKNYAPNVYVSALVVRGRVGEVQPTAMVDLGKPSYKLGISEIRVGWKTHELKVHVQPNHDVYQVRENAKVTIQVKGSDGKSVGTDSDVIVAAVDEGLLQLSPNLSWQLLESMMARRYYEVDTYTAQSEVIGKRHFGIKAYATGGGGGNLPTRELFDTLLYWNPRVPLDKNGEARIEIPLNDSITSFRIVGIARSGLGQFGTGFATMRSTRDLMILSGIPPVVREGDSFPAEFTVRNSTEKAMDVEVVSQVTGMSQAIPIQNLVLAPGASKKVSWEVRVPKGASSLEYDIRARTKGTVAAFDRLKVTQKVKEAVPVQVYQAKLLQVEGNQILNVQIPATAIPGKGGIRLNIKPSLLAGLSGVKEFMNAYPYSCLEQKVSTAVTLRDSKLWNQVMEELPVYLDSDGLAKYFPSGFLEGSDILTSYLISIADEANWRIPESSYQKMISGLQKFVKGGLSRKDPLHTGDLDMRKIAALNALSRSKNADASMLSSVNITPQLWPTSAVIDWYEILNKMNGIPENETKKKEAQQILRSRLNFQGTIMGFSTEKNDHLDWLMVSSDVNANRLILTLLASKDWAGAKDDLPKLVQGSLGRQAFGHWSTTTANAWGSVALEKYTHAYESVPVTGVTSFSLQKQDGNVDWKGTPQGKLAELKWPEGAQDLNLSHQGTGKPWVTVQSRAAIPLKEPVSSGLKVNKNYSPVEQKSSGFWKKGDLVRVHLEIESQTDVSWVVIQDPIPAGATILGHGLGNDSKLLTASSKSIGTFTPTFEERGFEFYRAYYQYLPKGKWTVDYTVRLNQSGTMNLPPTRLEAMYSPELFGESPNVIFQIAE